MMKYRLYYPGMVIGNIDFLGLLWLGVFVLDYKTEEQLLNILLEPNQEKEKKAFKQLEELLQE